MRQTLELADKNGNSISSHERALIETINKITNNNVAKEYYLTDMIEIANNNNIKINTYELPEDKTIEISNINTQEDLANIINLI